MRPEPPTPSVCAVTETSERYGANGLTVIVRDAMLEDTELYAVSVTV